MGRVAGIVETGDSCLAEHGVGVYVAVGVADMVHVCPLLSTDVWEAYDFCCIQYYLDLIEVGVLVLCVYCDGAAKFSHEGHLAHCVDPFLHLVNVFIVVRNNQLKLRLVVVLHRSRHKPDVEKHNARNDRKAPASDERIEQRHDDDGLCLFLLYRRGHI